jgi:glycosyltransferase involved in cell wall biosynthesis
MPVTVGMVTRDSAERLGRSFVLVLRRVKREVPFDRFILVDSSRLPATSQIASAEVGAEVVKADCNRAVARQTIIDMTRTEWLLFLDDDVLLDGGWFGPVSRLMEDESIGLIWGPMNKRQGSTANRSEAMRMFWREGSTTDTMLRMEALRGIRIPPFLHWREDTFIRNYVLSRGYRCAVSPVGMVHLKGRGQIIADNSRVDVKLKWLCERYVGTYRPSAKRSLTSVIAILLDPASARWRLGWFRYYSNLYLPSGDIYSTLQNIYKPRNQVGVK